MVEQLTIKLAEALNQLVVGSKAYAEIPTGPILSFIGSEVSKSYYII